MKQRMQLEEKIKEWLHDYVSEALAMKQRMQLMWKYTYRFWGASSQRPLQWNRGCNSSSWSDNSQHSCLRGTCNETEDATEWLWLHCMKYMLVSEALAMKQRMQHCYFKFIYSILATSQRHLQWNRGCNNKNLKVLESIENVSEALAMKQRMQLYLLQFGITRRV